MNENKRIDKGMKNLEVDQTIACLMASIAYFKRAQKDNQLSFFALLSCSMYVLCVFA
jgi:hypothetical protein